MHTEPNTLGPRPTPNTAARERLILLASVMIWGLSTGSPTMRPDVALDDAALAASVRSAPRIDRHDDRDFNRINAAPIITAVPTD